MGLFLALFALYFPERFEWELKRPWLKWLVIGPVAALNVLTALLRALCIFDFRALHTFAGGILTTRFFNAGTASSVLIAFFFFAILSKRKTAKATDSKRRLRILLVGSAVGLLPLVGLIVYESLGRDASQSLIIPVVLMFLLFPITLAYVIVAERAMNLRMVIRQGLRYTLARSGLRIVLGLITIGVLTAVEQRGFRIKHEFANENRAFRGGRSAICRSDPDHAATGDAVARSAIFSRHLQR